MSYYEQTGDRDKSGHGGLKFYLAGSARHPAAVSPRGLMHQHPDDTELVFPSCGACAGQKLYKLSHKVKVQLRHCTANYSKTNQISLIKRIING